MDLFYDLNITAFDLKGVEVGLRDNHLRGAVELHGHAEGAGPIKHGTITLKDDSAVAQWSFMVAGVVPVHIEVSLPTALDYAADWKGNLDGTAGVDLDVNLGDHSMRWTKDEGYTMHNTSTSWTAIPFAEFTSGEAAVDLTLSLHSTVQVDIKNVMWYHFKVNPSFPLELDFTHVPKLDQACLDGDADFLINHEADVHFSLLGKKAPVYHFGPKELYHVHKDKFLHKCVNKTESVMV